MSSILAALFLFKTGESMMYELKPNVGMISSVGSFNKTEILIFNLNLKKEDLLNLVQFYY